jgi:hypothetical protein
MVDCTFAKWIYGLLEKSFNEFAMTAEKSSRELGHAEMPVRSVDSIRPRAQVRHIGIGTGAAVQPHQHLGDRIANDVRIVILDREALLCGEIA